MKKKKNRFIQNLTNTKIKKVILVFLGILLLNAIISATTGFNIIVRAYNFLSAITNGYTEERKDVSIENDLYNLTIKADWINEREIKANYLLETKQENLIENKNIIFLFDNSADKNLCEMKEEMQNQIMALSKKNRVSLVTLNRVTTPIFSFTQEESVIQSGISNLSCSNEKNRNYYNALQYIENLEEEVYVLFFTSLPSNINTEQEAAAFQYVKTKKPNTTIKTIVYENKNYQNENTDEILYIDKNTLPKMIYYASSDERYELFKIEQTLNEEYFKDFSVTSDKGHTSIDKGTFTWFLEDDLKKGETINFEIRATLKEEYYDSQGFYPFYDNITIKTQLPNETIKEIRYREKNLLKNGYQVKYNWNAPSTCAINKNSYQVYHAFERGELISEIPTCLGYQFIGWNLEDGIEKINNKKFIMPAKDIEINGQWESVSITKRMSISKVPYLINFFVEEEKLEGEEKYIQLGENYGTLPQASKEGMNFDGWFTEENDLIEETTPLTIEKDHNLYAHFSPKSYEAVETTYNAHPTTNSYSCNCTNVTSARCVKPGGNCSSPAVDIMGNGGCTTNAQGVPYCSCGLAGGVNISCTEQSCQTCTNTTYSCPDGGTLSGTICKKYTCPDGGTLSGTTCNF